MSAITEVLDVRWRAEERSKALRRFWWLPLALILAIQALLSVRLIQGAPIASGDEGRYIYAGHQLIYELWHGGGSPYYETSFSGAPDLYPVLAAMVDHAGGLFTVRLMNTIFMMFTTWVLFGTARRLFGYVAGITAAGLFAGIGLTQDLGAYGTYDGMSLMLTACAAYCAVRAAASNRGSTWLLLIPLTILFANSVKYVTIIFDPIVILMAGICVSGTWKQACRRVMALGAATTLLLGVALFLAGTSYARGFVFTTLNRDSSLQAFLSGSSLMSTQAVLVESWRIIGLVVLLGFVALICGIILRADGRQLALLSILVLAGLLVTIEAVRLHSDQSMRKHDDFGAWFTCMAAGALPGYAQNFVKRSLGRYLATALAAGTIMLCALIYSPTARATYEANTDARFAAVVTYLKPYLENPGRLLLGGLSDDQIIYTDHLAIPWFQQFDDQYLKYPIPGRGGDSHGQTHGLACLLLEPHCMYLEGPVAYEDAILAHWFVFISMVGGHGTAQDADIEKTVEHTPGYVLLTRIGGAPTWIYAPAYRNMRG